ncbi:MAG: enoyl-CoA hydratase/isomerase family protein [Gammaproteobacteria bacterium]|nr:enoyl-CoA hydratase/isomerase family protein [Gammaproteobacteria bacterium]MBT8110672.1 enoyl-CoA hydratase/isomerase family protein [Gammaproteobacteria bacterium]NNL45371.1 3-hydroxyacyl-CoA dehydrogenase [Woeseiaceae bacterium]
MNTLDIKTDGNGIALITIDLKDRSMNVVSPEFIAEFDQAIDQLAGDEKIKGAVVTSGKSSFVAGADLLQIVDEIDPGADPKVAFAKWSGLQQLYRKLETCGKPVVAAINGTALGGGLELCLACHYRVAADNPKAKLGQPEVQVGLLPGAGGTQRLPRLIGLEAALPLLLQGTHLSPAKATELGVVDLLVKPGQEVDAAKQWILDGGEAVQPWDKKGFKVPGGAGLMNPKAIQTQMFGVALLQKTTNHNYPAPIAIMSAVYEGSVLPIDSALQIESKYFAELLTNVVARNMIRTLFVNKGAADKLVRRPQGIDKSKVTKLGVLGAGMMGAGIAFVSARAGMQVVLLDRSKDDAEKGKDYSRKLLQKRVDRGRMDADAAAEVLELIQTTDDYADLDGCEYVIEAVFEDRGIKADVTAKTEAVIGSDAIFGSNTSTLPITGLAEASRRPGSFIGIHFFSPVDKMPLVEVIVGEKTDDAAIARTLDYIQQIRKTPIVVNDSRGFYTSRVFSTFTREGIAMLAEGVNPALIENVAKHAGMPVGPLAVTDEVSLELAYKIGKQTKADLGDDYVATPADDVMEKMVVDLDRRGKRFGAGFYEYSDDGSKRLWKGLTKHFPLADEQPTPREVKTRLLYVQAIDAARCLEEGVLTHPADADVGSVFGWGFPPYTGGTLSFIETVGPGTFVAEADRLAKDYGARFQIPKGLRAMAENGETYYGLAAKGQARSAA